MRNCLCLFRSIIIMGSLLMGGCANALEPDEIAVPLGTGCELAGIDDSMLEISAQFSVPAGGTEQGTGDENNFIVLTSTGRTVTEASQKLTAFLPQTPVFTHVQSFIMGEKLAQYDVGLLADFMGRIPASRETTTLFISRGSTPDEILNTSTPLEPHSGVGLANMINIQERQIGLYQPVRFHDFFMKLTKSGIEPVCPQVAVESNGDKKVLKLVGTAVFKKNRMVGELNAAESRAFRMMDSKGMEGGLLIVNWDENTLITMEQIRLRSSYRANIDEKGQLKMKIEITGEGNFYEQSSPGEILTLSGIKKVNKQTEQQIEREIRQCIHKAQLMGSDIFGWGLYFEQQYPAVWHELKSDWPHYFAQIEPEIDVSYQTRRTYLMDQSFTFRN